MPLSVNFVAEYAAMAYARGVVSEFADDDSILADVKACTLSPVVAFAVLYGDESIPNHARDMLHAPTSYKFTQAQLDWLKWEAAMCQEKNSLEEKHIFEHVPALPAGQKAIPLIWVYSLKTGPGRDTIEKARVVVLGNHQGSLDFGETYSAVAQAMSIWIVLVYTASQKWFLFKIGRAHV